MNDCIFCRIIKGDIPSAKVYEDELCYAFKDINPQAPAHVLVVPKKHAASVLELGEEDKALLGHIQLVIGKLAKELGVSETGFRVMTNCGSDACQSVKHLHYHLLGGVQMSEKMV
ncbi:MAG: histidine triad nucleotide-binding protein [Clostridia bacterium]|nr:histidine triad nucleotide-binding protein [Clostridia bacterium]